MTNNLTKKVISSLEIDKDILKKINENQKISEESWDKFYKLNEEVNKLYRKFLESLNPRIEIKIAVELWDKIYKSNKEANKLCRELLENSSPRIETKIAVKKIINNKYNLQSHQNYYKINSQLNIQKY